MGCICIWVMNQDTYLPTILSSTLPTTITCIMQFPLRADLFTQGFSSKHGMHSLIQNIRVRVHATNVDQKDLWMNGNKWRNPITRYFYQYNGG
mmetsp:Transcript_31955/g.53890  ORF Transcript_31955/g.53890 Transcript_31955/m.53890 type:complete len:93 (+) Transcript_31955:585-863(+)